MSSDSVLIQLDEKNYIYENPYINNFYDNSGDRNNYFIETILSYLKYNSHNNINELFKIIPTIFSYNNTKRNHFYNFYFLIFLYGISSNQKQLSLLAIFAIVSTFLENSFNRQLRFKDYKYSVKGSYSKRFNGNVKSIVINIYVYDYFFYLIDEISKSYKTNPDNSHKTLSDILCKSFQKFSNKINQFVKDSYVVSGMTEQYYKKFFLLSSYQKSDDSINYYLSKHLKFKIERECSLYDDYTRDGMSKMNKIYQKYCSHIQNEYWKLFKEKNKENLKNIIEKLKMNYYEELRNFKKTREEEKVYQTKKSKLFRMKNHTDDYVARKVDLDFTFDLFSD